MNSPGKRDCRLESGRRQWERKLRGETQKISGGNIKDDLTTSLHLSPT